MKTVRMFGRTATLYRSPTRITVTPVEGEPVIVEALTYTMEEAEKRGAAEFYRQRPDGRISTIRVANA